MTASQSPVAPKGKKNTPMIGLLRMGGITILEASSLILKRTQGYPGAITDQEIEILLAAAQQAAPLVGKVVTVTEVTIVPEPEITIIKGLPNAPKRKPSTKPVLVGAKKMPKKK